MGREEGYLQQVHSYTDSHHISMLYQPSFRDLWKLRWQGMSVSIIKKQVWNYNVRWFWSQLGTEFGPLLTFKVRLGLVKSNKAVIISETSTSPVVSLACNADGTFAVSGHLDGSIYRYSIQKDSIEVIQSVSIFHPLENNWLDRAVWFNILARLMRYPLQSLISLLQLETIDKSWFTNRQVTVRSINFI